MIEQVNQLNFYYSCEKRPEMRCTLSPLRTWTLTLQAHAKLHDGKCALRFLKHFVHTAMGASMPSYCPSPSGHFSPTKATGDDGGLNCGASPTERARNEPRLFKAAAAKLSGCTRAGDGAEGPGG